MVRDGNSGSDQPGSSDVGQSFAVRKMVEQFEPILLKILEQPMMLKKLETMMLNIVRPVVQSMVISTVQQEIMPAVEPLLRKVVIEEFQKLFPGGTRNDVPKERILLLKFIDEVLDPVHTSKELRGIKDYPLQVALLDETGQIVTCGPESSALVEIVLADASGKDDEHNVTHGNFERRIIKTGDKEKPHFAKSVYINLKKGIGDLNDVKLGQPSDWTKNCKCSLGVRLVRKFKGITVQEAWTAPFKVKDNRGELYKNHDRPSLGSEVWRLKEIGRGGKPHRRLEEEKIKTVQDLRFWLSVNPKGLQKIIGAGDNKWKTIVEHAQTCNIDDKRIFFHKSSTEPQMGVIYDAVGELKGVIDESKFVPVDNMSADKKNHADKLLSSVLERSAFGERYKTSFNDEASLLQEFPHRLNASTNSSMQQLSNGCGLSTLSENISGYQTAGPGTSSQSIIPNNTYDYGPSGSLGSRNTIELCDPVSVPFHAPENTNGDNPTDLDYVNQTSTSIEILEADPRELLASAWENVEPLNDMNYLQHLTGLATGMDSLNPNCPGGVYQNAGTSEMVEDSSSRRSKAPFHSPSLTMNSFGNTITDDMEIIYDADTQHNHTRQCSSELFEGLDEIFNQYRGYVEPQVVNTPNSWKQLVCVLKWWFSISKRVSARKRKRINDNAQLRMRCVPT